MNHMCKSCVAVIAILSVVLLNSSILLSSATTSTNLERPAVSPYVEYIDRSGAVVRKGIQSGPRSVYPTMDQATKDLVIMALRTKADRLAKRLGDSERVRRIRLFADIVAASNRAERHRLVQDLGVVITEVSTPTETIKEFKLGGRTRVRLVTPSVDIPYEEPQDVGGPSVGKPSVKPVQQPCYDQYGNIVECADDEEVEENLAVAVAANDEVEDMNGELEEGPNCFDEAAGYTLAAGASLGTNLMAIDAYSGHLAGTALISAEAALGWGFLVVTGLGAATYTFYNWYDCAFGIAPAVLPAGKLHMPAGIRS